VLHPTSQDSTVEACGAAVQHEGVAELLEREELLAQLDRARADGGRLLFVGGEAGVGKTSLTRAFAARVDGRVLEGACENLTTPTPLGPLVDVATETGGDVAARVASGGDPRLVATALLQELRGPAVLVLEDVHWADQATLDVLRVLGRRIESTAALVLATYREDEVEGEHPLRVVLGELASAPAVSRLSVPRLSIEAVRELAAPHGADGDALHRLTHGNAFYVTEVLAVGPGTLPETVRDAVLARAAGLDPAARRLLDLVALVPARTEEWLLEAVAPDELEHLDECLAAGMLRSEGDAVAFRHELARLALESVVPAQRRRRLHASILDALASPPVGSPDPSRLAHHAEEAGDIAAVLEHAPRAARRAATAGAHREAAAQYARALRHADGLPAAERAALLSGYAQEAQLTGGYEEAADARKQAIALYRELDDRLGEGDTLWRLTMPYIALGRNAEAEHASRAAIDLLETLPPGRQLANAYGGQAYMRMLGRDNAEGVAWGEKTVALARKLGDEETLSFGLNMIGTSYMMAGEIERGIEHLEQSLEIARRDELELRIGSALAMLGTGLGEMYELERAEGYLREHITFAEERETELSYQQAWLALVLGYQGRWDESTELARDTLARSDEAITRISAFIALGRARARRGDPGATEVLDEALELAQPGGHLQRLGHVHAARAEAAWLAGDSERVVAEAQAAYDLALEKRHLWFAGELAYWQWKAGTLDEAPRWIAEPYRLQLAGEARAAAEAWEARGCPYEAARALAEAGGEDALRAALEAFERLGARPAAQACARSLRSLGVRGPRPATRANPGGLTARELEVLDLIVEGLRNAEIAERLVITEKTVGHHVSAILAKLGVRSRYDAARLAQDRESAGPG
jgi:DNA-binding CsgD family transcriptional regulator/tetratricopeptide (TPR) repeat protein